MENGRLSGLCYAFVEPLVGDNIDKVEATVITRCRWLWDENLEDHLQEAISLMDGRDL